MNGSSNHEYEFFRFEGCCFFYVFHQTFIFTIHPVRATLFLLVIKVLNFYFQYQTIFPKVRAEIGAFYDKDRITCAYTLIDV